MPVPTSLDSFKAVLSIPNQSFHKILNHQAALEAQGVTKDTTVWLMIGGLFGGADVDMVDSPLLACSAATPDRRPIFFK